jgi:hypothetical protein
MVVVHKSHPEVGICASKLLTADGAFIDSAGDGFSGFRKSFERGEGKESMLYTNTEYVFDACAGVVVYRRSMLKEIGLSAKYSNEQRNRFLMAKSWSTKDEDNLQMPGTPS